MSALKAGATFHHKLKTDVTYTVKAINYETETLDIYWHTPEGRKTTQYYLPLAEKHINRGIWVLGEGSDVMCIVVAGELLKVETACLFENQYNTENERVYDFAVSRIINDKRDIEDRGIWKDWEGTKPLPDLNLINNNRSSSVDYVLRTWGGGSDPYSCELRGFKGGYSLTLRVRAKGVYYYNFNNSGSYGSFNFIYKDGVFYECNKMNYTRLASANGITKPRHLYKKVTKVAQVELINFFKENYRA